MSRDVGTAARQKSEALTAALAFCGLLFRGRNVVSQR